MVRDIEYLSTRLGKVEGFGDLGEYLLKIVRSKDVVKADPPTAPPPEDAPKGKEAESEVKKGVEKEGEGGTSPESKSNGDPGEKEGDERKTGEKAEA